MKDTPKKEIVRHYRCKICDSTHKIKLKKDIIDGKAKFPFPYVVLHDSINSNHEIKELLTILYIDKDLQIRSSEIQEIVDDSLFSKEQVVSMTKTLMKENMLLKEDLNDLTTKLNQLTVKYNKLKNN